MRIYRPRSVGQGYREPNSYGGEALRLAVTFDPDTFEQLRQRAAQNNQSLAAVVRDLVEWGMMS